MAKIHINLLANQRFFPLNSCEHFILMPIKYNFLDLSLAIIFQVKIGQPLKTQKKAPDYFL